MFVIVSFVVQQASADEDKCRKLLDSYARINVSQDQNIDPHTTRLLVSSANRIARSSLWTIPTSIKKLNSGLIRAKFSHQNVDLDVYANAHAEIQGYVRGKSIKQYWCMQENK